MTRFQLFQRTVHKFMDTWQCCITTNLAMSCYVVAHQCNITVKLVDSMTTHVSVMVHLVAGS